MKVSESVSYATQRRPPAYYIDTNKLEGPLLIPEMHRRPPEEPQRRPKRSVEEPLLSPVRARMPIPEKAHKKSKYHKTMEFLESEGIDEELEQPAEEVIALAANAAGPAAVGTVAELESMDIDSYSAVDIYGIDEEFGNIKDFLRDMTSYKGEQKIINYVKDIPKRVYMERGKYMAAMSDYDLPKEKLD